MLSLRIPHVRFESVPGVCAIDQANCCFARTADSVFSWLHMPACSSSSAFLATELAVAAPLTGLVDFALLFNSFWDMSAMNNKEPVGPQELVAFCAGALSTAPTCVGGTGGGENSAALTLHVAIGGRAGASADDLNTVRETAAQLLPSLRSRIRVAPSGPLYEELAENAVKAWGRELMNDELAAPRRRCSARCG